MDLDPAELSRRDRYYWMIGAIVPRPIAFVSTRAADGALNLAPFSYFVGVGSNPPTVALGLGSRRDGSPKDTLANATATGELVINVVTEAMAEAMVATSADFPPEVSEFEACGFTPAPSTKVAPPRVAESPIALECTLAGTQEVGGSTLLLAEIVWIHCDDAVTTDGLPDPAKLRPLARLGGQLYAGLGDIFPIER